jgi:hypothetical protein
MTGKRDSSFTAPYASAIVPPGYRSNSAIRSGAIPSADDLDDANRQPADSDDTTTHIHVNEPLPVRTRWCPA